MDSHRNDPNNSPWIDDWTDENRRLRYEQHATELYNSHKEFRLLAHRSHVDYAKWLLASGLAVHGGALYAISSLPEKTNHNINFDLLLNAALWHIGGIVFALFSGFMG